MALLLIGGEPAYAYIDPGSGSAIMSAFIGLVVSVSVVIKTFWYKFKRLIGLSKSGKNPAVDSDDVLAQREKGKLKNDS